ncbi:uncharacterized protein STEHIDRAFT_112890 [Stereum hirsutum FP-91666 SS1]|uniref:uncharacterized protein n=1 Tax=Stereum hirsutum (strain FP-91666) TaxID=721885 RepID=UPI0004449BB3|nr:uncharacterized protein STEHIDRAFT_112890 [Stereum hirsutum FP-91666 SS1]EIM84540.1 hypothetical protein STEHIDRAFT_112890 [Stereum hirsutum FP-91666 SS1]
MFYTSNCPSTLTPISGHTLHAQKIYAQLFHTSNRPFTLTSTYGHTYADGYQLEDVFEAFNAFKYAYFLLRTNPSAFVSSADCVVMCFAESKTRSGRGYSAWDTATVIKVDIDATSLLQRAVESERTRQYDEDASPEFSPALTPTRTSNGITVIKDTASTLSEVSKRLASSVHPPSPATHNNPVTENLYQKSKEESRQEGQREEEEDVDQACRYLEREEDSPRDSQQLR